MPEQEVIIDFSDVTLASQEGNFAEVQKIMSEGMADKEKWMIRTDATIITQFGANDIVLHFYGNGKIYIMRYSSVSDDVFYNPDISALSQWAQQSGWKIPEPNKDLLLSDKVFWKYLWETNLIESNYFDELYGKKEDFEKDNKEEEEI